MRSRKCKLVAIGILLVITTISMTACGCNHEWQDATCQAPRTCVLCGKTEGKVRSHDWGNTACDSPEPCTMCGTMEGMELTHQWRSDCRICTSCGKDERPADDRFPEAVARGLENRWALAAAALKPEPETETDIDTETDTDIETDTESETEKEEKTLTKEDWEKMFDAEYQQVIEFKDETFRDRELAEYAIRYVNSIVESMESLKYFDTEQWEDQYLNSVYHEQSLVLYHINQMCPISISDEYQEEFQEFLKNGKMVDDIYSLFDQVMFLQLPQSEKEKIYETTIRNTTEMDFEFFSFEVNLLDEEGKIIETKVTTVKSWKSGEKVRFRFTTTEDFQAIDTKYATWRLST